MNTDIDLHGFRLEEAESEVMRFVDQLYFCGETSGRIIHGMGMISEKLPQWLRNYPYVKSFERNPFNPEAHFNYALIIEGDGRLDEAATHYRQAIENDPGHRLAHFHLGRILVYQERLPEAIPHFRETLVPEDDNTPRFTYALGATYARLDDKEQALHYLREALRKATVLGQAELAHTIERDLKGLEPEP